MRRFRVAAAFVAAALVPGCGDVPRELAEPNPPVELRFAEPRTPSKLPLRGFDRAQGFPPVLHAEVVRHSGELTSEPVELATGGTLEFVPIVFGSAEGGCDVDVELVSEEHSEVVWSGPPLFVSRRESRDPFGRFAKPVEVALPPQAGPFRLRWVGRGACRERPGALARAALLPPHVPRRPILLICSDTHRYDHALGDGAGLMPRLQQMAKFGVVYDRAYSPASWTLPSIASTLTGLYPAFHRTGERVVSGSREDWDPRRELPPGQFPISWGDEYHVFTAYPESLGNLGTRLREYGYETAAIVANTLYVGSGLLSAGFDLVIDANGRPGADVNLLVQRLLQRDGRERPLFLLVHYMDVHEYVAQGVRPGDPSGPRKTLRTDDLRRRYARQVRAADEFIGRLVAAWNSAVGLGPSFVAIYSDHGEHLREPHRPTETHGDSMDEVLLHVPLVVRYPGEFEIEPGRESRSVSLVDLLPTILDVVGIPHDPDALQGNSLLRPAAGDDASRALFAGYQLAGDDLASVRRGPFKLILNATRGTRALFDVAGSDRPEEEERVEDPERESQLADLFESHRARAEVVAAGLRSERVMDEDLEERLRAIGYAE